MNSVLVAVIERLMDDVGDKIAVDVPMGALTTYRVGGRAAAMVVVDDHETLSAVAAAVAGTGIPVMTLGRGSNMLVADRGFDGLVIHLAGDYAAINVVDETIVIAGAAAKLPVVARTTAGYGLTGFEWAVGVPGSIGGAVRMNAGGHGADTKDALLDADVVDFAAGERRIVPAEELQLSYRHSALRTDELVVGCRLSLSPGDERKGKAEMAEIVQWRRDNQPGGQNAGSVFTNPDGESAGRLIDTAGGKGLRVGTAEVSAKHANFIQADEGGTAADVLRVMIEARTLVEFAHGVVLQPETHLVGFTDDEVPWPS
ncbi:MAG: UDP-N-acetylenolpyruvoylglucosamine reductase [Acidimicrobiaceae bacterium]|nr:UDP-N-acetylenolpyruvoylglucosamine reductase [Acidimicrobiaceae bacterium]HAB59051.1 UDP-N-acetylenolpyruvoylglucosamine reductase [Acidimicrobiaceae bacterium]